MKDNRFAHTNPVYGLGPPPDNRPDDEDPYEDSNASVTSHRAEEKATCLLPATGNSTYATHEGDGDGTYADLGSHNVYDFVDGPAGTYESVEPPGGGSAVPYDTVDPSSGGGGQYDTLRNIQLANHGSAPRVVGYDSVQMFNSSAGSPADDAVYNEIQEMGSGGFASISGNTDA